MTATNLGYIEHFTHVRIIIGMVLGISVSRLVVGMSEFLQHPKRKKIYLVHIGWVLYLFLTITHFWWYEFGLVKIKAWSFGLYFFLISFACLFAFVASLLFPSSMAEYESYEDYFQSRRRTFYVMFTVLAVADVVDTAIKGSEHFLALGIEYPIQQAVLILLSVIAIFVPSKTYQGVFVTTVLLYKTLWIFRLFGVLD
ncbi:MAG: hypothetical protein KA735_13145 [Burkholderiaceae bacterium]|nr:hypothetical protein [Burkholderiaceae bacterium]